MCPLPIMAQFYVIVMIVFLLISHGAFSQQLNCFPKNCTVNMGDMATITCNLTGTDISRNTHELWTEVKDNYVAKTSNRVLLNYVDDKNYYKGSFNITGSFLGKTLVTVRCKEKSQCQQDIPVTVVRKQRAIDHAFTGSVILLVSIIYINFGCALKWSELKYQFKRPIGPIIGCIGQFVVMPLLSYGLGKALFPNNAPMQLGMFFTGVSPGGGASNMWTVILGGNINLSILMTTISTIAALGTMPLWLFTLGKTIFDESDIPVPYMRLIYIIFGLIIPLFIGFLIQRYLSKVGQILARMLKCVSALLLIFIIIFAIVTNFYLFELFSYKIVIAGLLLPLVGYIVAGLMARFLKQSPEDCIAIAVETGIQNTGIAILLLRVALLPPSDDLTTVVPVAVATMTPLPLLLLYIWQKINARFFKKTKNERKPDLNSNETNEM